MENLDQDGGLEEFRPKRFIDFVKECIFLLNNTGNF